MGPKAYATSLKAASDAKTRESYVTALEAAKDELKDVVALLRAMRELHVNFVHATSSTHVQNAIYEIDYTRKSLTRTVADYTSRIDKLDGNADVVESDEEE
jgi:hypothetical protein